MAASYGADKVVKLLMERDADVTIRDTSLRSILHAAVGDVESMEALLQVIMGYCSDDNDRQTFVELGIVINLQPWPTDFGTEPSKHFQVCRLSSAQY